MSPRQLSSHAGRRSAELAARQHGNVTTAQLRHLGISATVIRHWSAEGRLHVELHGVYAVGRPAGTPIERSAAAVLACGPGALLSHRSALALHGLAPWPHKPQVLVPGDRRHPRVQVHRSRSFDARDGRRREGIAVTSPARTLLDCAPELTQAQLTRAVNDAVRRGVTRRDQIAELLSRCPTHRGAPKLRRLICDQTVEPTRSGFEDEFLVFCASNGLPRPLVNTTVVGFEVDAYFPLERLIVEMDGWEFHQSRTSFEGDRERDAATLAEGIATVRLTWRRLRDDPPREAQRLRDILAARASQPAARASQPAARASQPAAHPSQPESA